jgi:hypothetical protein
MRVEAIHRAPRPGERERLLAWTARSRKLQGRLKKVLIGGVPLVIGLMISSLDGTIVLICASMLFIVVGVGLWITAGHIREWAERLREMDLAVAAQQRAARAEAAPDDGAGARSSTP